MLLGDILTNFEEPKMNFLLLPLLILSFFPAASMAESRGQSWESEIQNHIRTLSRAMDIYTWDTRNRMGSQPRELVLPNDTRAFEFLRREAASFYDPQAKLQYEGPNGVYFASGPFVSREWGSGQKNLFQGDLNWMLIRVRLPIGTRYLDGRSSKPFGPAMLSFLQGYNCYAKNMRELLEVNRRRDKVQCWNAYTHIVPQIKVFVMAKEFISIAPEYCPVQNKHFTDFIVVDDSIMKDYAVFVPEIHAQDAGNIERYFIRDYWLLSKQTVARKCAGVKVHQNWWDRFKYWDNCRFFVTSPDQFELPWSLPNSPYTPMQMRAMTEERIFGCGPKAAEDIP